METEQASLSTIIIDSNGNPIGQVIYRCALCRKICDSSSDAMIHYQVDHIQAQQQHSLAASNHQTLSHHQSQSARAGSHHQRINHSQPASSGRHQQFPTSAATSTANSLLKRATSSSLLKRASHASLPSTSAAGQNSLLKRGPNVMRCYESGSGPATKASMRRQLNSANKLESIHRQYTTTSASRAAKRHMNPAKGANSTTTTTTNANNATAGSNNSTSVNAGSQQATTTKKEANVEKTRTQEKSNEPENEDSEDSASETEAEPDATKSTTTNTHTSVRAHLSDSNSRTTSSSNLNKTFSPTTHTRPALAKHQISPKNSTPDSDMADQTGLTHKDSINNGTLATGAVTAATARRLALTPKSYNLRRRFKQSFKNKN